jgi:hypothetical protein
MKWSYFILNVAAAAMLTGMAARGGEEPQPVPAPAEKGAAVEPQLPLPQPLPGEGPRKETPPEAVPAPPAGPKDLPGEPPPPPPAAKKKRLRPGLNVITGSGNGIGNQINVGGGWGGTTVIQNSRNGIGNRIQVENGGGHVIVDLDNVWVGGCYFGKDSRFWTHRVWSESRKCHCYWCPKTRAWYRYDGWSDCYFPLEP